MQNTKTKTKSKQEYLESWNSYIDSLYALCWVNDIELSKELSKEVKTNIDNLKALLERVAKDKKKSGGVA